MLEFEQVYGTAKAKHAEVLRLIQRFWAGVARKQNGKYLVGASHYVSRISDTARAAANSYEALLRKYKSSKMLLRTYGDFVASVLNDPERAHMFYLRADEIEEQEAARLGGGATDEGRTEGTGDGTSDGPDGSSHGGSSSQVKDHVAAKKKKNRNDGFLNNEGQLKAVRRLHTGSTTRLFYLSLIKSSAATGLSILCLEVVSFYLISRLLLDKISEGIARITDIASHARSVSSITDHARTLQLSASLNYTSVYQQEVSLLQQLGNEFREAHRGLYFGKPGVPASSAQPIVDLWNSPNIDYQVYLPAVNNGEPTYVRQKIQPSIRRVQKTKSGISDILNVIPRRALRKIARYYAKMRPPDAEDSDQELGKDDALQLEDDDEDETGTTNGTVATGPDGLAGGSERASTAAPLPSSRRTASIRRMHMHTRRETKKARRRRRPSLPSFNTRCINGSHPAVYV
eukprot:tig00000455_g1033.t1